MNRATALTIIALADAQAAANLAIVALAGWQQRGTTDGPPKVAIYTGPSGSWGFTIGEAVSSIVAQARQVLKGGT